MSLKPCYECKAPVSSLAWKCRHCGAPTTEARFAALFIGALLIFIIVTSLKGWL